jgi:hypothetical protein
MSNLEHGAAGRVVRRPWEVPVLSVLVFRATAGTQQAGADNPEVASFTPGTPGTPGGPGGGGIVPPGLKGSATCDGPIPAADGTSFISSKGGVAFDSFCQTGS